MAPPYSPTYFSDHYTDLRWPLATADVPGFRPPQAGALHAVAAHFSQPGRPPALITMPTGSGKTAILCATPFLLRPTRVLVLTPSRLVREQVVEEFKALRTLVALGGVPGTMPPPIVVGVRNRVTTAAAWEAFREANVIVGLPSSLSPELSQIPAPPPDLFDLVLVDEAHHAAAETWKTILGHFQSARQVLFTATPFRNDRKQLLGRFVYTYDLKAAFADGVFGRLEYSAVNPAPGEDADVAIAKATEAVWRSDRAQGLDHLVMVRTGQVTKAHELATLYATHTQLRLATITGGASLRAVTKILAQLAASELDGIICVDMLGEGFDLPSLKIAALHRPHRSLPVVLQFIGRFARTTGERLGRATFLALASDMAIESQKLFTEGAVWEEIVQNLSGLRVAQEQRMQEVLTTFAETTLANSDRPDLSLYSLRPFLHAKILNAGLDANITQELPLPGNAQVVHRHVSEDHDTVITVCRRSSRPRWTTAAHLDSIEYDLYILHLHRASGLLFVTTSRRLDEVYQHFAHVLAPPGGPDLRGVSSARLNHVLAGLQESRFFNVGMRPVSAANREMSYKTIAGSSVDQSIELNDARGFHRGHWFGQAIEDGRSVTIGLSVGSKVWSNTSAQIASLIDWCDHLAAKIASNTVAQTHSGLDRLSIGEEATTIPAHLVYVDWPKEAYTRPESIRYRASNGAEVFAQLLDLDISVDRSRTSETSIGLLISGEGLRVTGTFSFDTNRLIELDTDGAPAVWMDNGAPDSFIAYLNEHLPVFYTAELGELNGFTFFAPQPSDSLVFDSHRITELDWTDTDITKEVGSAGDRKTVHEKLSEILVASPADNVFYDHGSGEVADFVTVSQEARRVIVELFHCKGSGAPAAGARVDDVYEVCAQAIKSHNWRDQRRLLEAVRRRLRTRPNQSRFLKGQLADVEALLNGGQQVGLQITVVQPGLSKAGMTPQISAVLAAADEFVFTVSSRLRVLASA